eukprot:1747288-Amphidinium_carterae.1
MRCMSTKASMLRLRGLGRSIFCKKPKCRRDSLSSDAEFGQVWAEKVLANPSAQSRTWRIIF